VRAVCAAQLFDIAKNISRAAIAAFFRAKLHSVRYHFRRKERSNGSYPAAQGIQGTHS
jgi:hypothetical protein